MPAKTALEFLRAKGAGRKLTLVTCYDYTFARLLSGSEIDGILIGDSAAMVMHGKDSTLPATVEMIRTHTAAVVRGAPDRFVIADMPFLSHRMGIGPAVEAARELMAAGAHAVKLEGVEGHEDVIERLAGSGVPVMGHLGLQPQSVKAYGGYQPRGREAAEAARIAENARRLAELGVFSIVLECIPAPLAKQITESLGVPTIGIGAGPHCDGQILVLQDLLGLNIDFQPRFVRRFLDGGALVQQAIAAYRGAVESGEFPGPEESYK